MTPLRVVKIFTDGSTQRTQQKRRQRIGAGIVALCEEHRGEWSLDIGEGNAQQAELFAIFRALDLLQDRHTLSVCVITDSRYCVKLLAKGWEQPSTNTLVAHIRELILSCGAFHIAWVKGHGDCKENNRADELARRALRGGR